MSLLTFRGRKDSRNQLLFFFLIKHMKSKMECASSSRSRNLRDSRDRRQESGFFIPNSKFCPQEDSARKHHGEIHTYVYITTLGRIWHLLMVVVLALFMSILFHKILKRDQVLHSDERFGQYTAAEYHHRSSNLEGNEVES